MNMRELSKVLYPMLNSAISSFNVRKDEPVSIKSLRVILDGMSVDDAEACFGRLSRNVRNAYNYQQKQNWSHMCVVEIGEWDPRGWDSILVETGIYRKGKNVVAVSKTFSYGLPDIMFNGEEALKLA